MCETDYIDVDGLSINHYIQKYLPDQSTAKIFVDTFDIRLQSIYQEYINELTRIKILRTNLNNLTIQEVLEYRTYYFQKRTKDWKISNEINLNLVKYYDAIFAKLCELPVLYMEDLINKIEVDIDNARMDEMIHFLVEPKKESLEEYRLNVEEDLDNQIFVVCNIFSKKYSELNNDLAVHLETLALYRLLPI